MAFTRFLVGPLFVLSALLYSSFWVIPSILMLPFSVKYSRLLIEQLVMETLFGLVAVSQYVFNITNTVMGVSINYINVCLALLQGECALCTKQTREHCEMGQIPILCSL